MIYLLDTDTVIFMLRGLRAPARRRAHRDKSAAIVSRCRAAQVHGDVVGLSAITVSELEFGAFRADDYDREISAVRKLLAPFEVFDYDGVDCPGRYGRIRHALEGAGKTIGSMDLLIAAHALALGATLATNNVAHFRRVPGLALERWA